MILKSWLGGLDSNQDSQIQSLESYQLDDLPADGKLQEVAEQGKSSHPHFNLSRVNGTPRSVNLQQPRRDPCGILLPKSR